VARTDAGRKVVVSQRFFDEKSVRFLRSHGADVHIVPLPAGKGDGDFSPAELRGLLAGARGWIVGHARITRELLATLPELEIIARRGVGYERVDLAAAAELGKVVTIASGGNHAAVADHAVALMLAVARRFRESQARMASGDWSILIGSDLCKKTVGVVGLGRVGRSVVERLRGFDVEILACTRTLDEGYAREHGVAFVGLDELLARSDYVSLHAPLTDGTRFMIDADALARMKPGAILVNVARGGLVDDAALLEALRKGKLAGAGLDVFASESDERYRAVTEALLALPNIVASPHAAASSREGLDLTNMIAAQCVVAVLEGRTPAPGCVVADGRKIKKAG
jgi:D-3-phosphoglycerate dehydrogenase